MMTLYRIAEFGNLCGRAVAGDPDSEMAAMARCVKDFDAVRARSFPDWQGPMELVTNPYDPFRHFVLYGWYAQVTLEETTP